MVVKGCSRFVEDKLLSCQCPLAGILCACSGMIEKNLFNGVLYLFNAGVIFFL